MLTQQVDPDLAAWRPEERDGDDQIALLLLQVGRDEAAVLAPDVGEVQPVQQFRRQEPQQIAQVLRVLEEPQDAPVIKLADQQQQRQLRLAGRG